MEQYRPTGFSVLPPVVKNLLIINGLFFLATITFQQAYNIDLVDYLGLHYFKASRFNPYQFITYMFMHANFSHIFFNMFALWMFGNILENTWGPKRFLTYYLITGIGAALIQYIVMYYQITPGVNLINNYIANPDMNQLRELKDSGLFSISQEAVNHFNQFVTKISHLPNDKAVLNASVNMMQEIREDYYNMPVVLGASGAVFGILLAFGMMFPNMMIYLYFAIPIKAKWFVIGYGAIELISGIYGAAGDNVAHFAHLGGMLFGFILIKIWYRKKNNRNFNEF